MSRKVVLFSTRSFDEGGLFTTESTERVLIKEFSSPFVTYLMGTATHDEKKKLDYLQIKPSKPCWEALVQFLITNGFISDSDKDNPEEELIKSVIPYVRDNAEFKELHSKYRDEKKMLQSMTPMWDFTRMEANDGFCLNIDAKNKPSSNLLNRFSFFRYKDTNKEKAADDEYIVFMIWPLGRVEPYNKGSKNIWIDALLLQIKVLVGECDSIYLILHDGDLYGIGKPFEVIETKKEYGLAIFQHSPGDPIKSILNEANQSSKEVYDHIERLMSIAPEMIKASENNQTQIAYTEETSKMLAPHI